MFLSWPARTVLTVCWLGRTCLPAVIICLHPTQTYSISQKFWSLQIKQFQYMNSLLLFPWAFKRRVLAAKLPCASKVKASPWPVLPELECWEGVWGQTQITCTKYPKKSPLSAVCLTGTQDCAGSGTRELTHMQHYYWKARKGFAFEMTEFKCLFLSYIIGYLNFSCA